MNEWVVEEKKFRFNLEKFEAGYFIQTKTNKIDGHSVYLNGFIIYADHYSLVIRNLHGEEELQISKVIDGDVEILAVSDTLIPIIESENKRKENGSAKATDTVFLINSEAETMWIQSEYDYQDKETFYEFKVKNMTSDFHSRNDTVTSIWMSEEEVKSLVEELNKSLGKTYG